MTLRAQLAALVAELDRAHADSQRLWKEVLADTPFPTFSTAANGHPRYFLPNARELLRLFVSAYYRNRPDCRLVIDRGRFAQLVRQAVTDLHAAGEFAAAGDERAALRALDAKISASVAEGVRPYTHHLPAQTLGIESAGAFQVGPVTFRTREHWIDAVDFPASFLDTYASLPAENHAWKPTLKAALAAAEPAKPAGAAGLVYSAIRACSALLSVEITGLELGLSTQLADIVAKAGLDAVSLTFGDADVFHQQALLSDRSLPLGTNSLVSTDAGLWLPGSHTGPVLPRISPSESVAWVKQCADYLDAFGHCLTALVSPTAHPHPRLAQRWTTALDWFAEGQRERSDAIALAKLATSLDVLSNGGKYEGILAMVEHLTGKRRDDVVVKGDAPMTLANVIKEVYDRGRSQILHGTRTDRMEPLEHERKIASEVSRVVLIECAMRLHNYLGEDEHKAFRSMAAMPSS